MKNQEFPTIPHYENSVIAIESQGRGEGNWVGGANAIIHKDKIYITGRGRRPEDKKNVKDKGRGGNTFIMSSSIDNGITFTDVFRFTKQDLSEKLNIEADSMEKPALIFKKNDSEECILYISRAIPGTKDWDIIAFEAKDPASFDLSKGKIVLNGKQEIAVKDPVVKINERGIFDMWVTCHMDPYGDPDNADRMYTAHTTSTDGLEWGPLKKVLSGREGKWDQRGARITAVDGNIAYYDGRESGENYVLGGNFGERTGVALWDQERNIYLPQGDQPIAQSPYGTKGLRYLTFVDLPNGNRMMYYEAPRSNEDAAHDIRVELVTASKK